MYTNYRLSTPPPPPPPCKTSTHILGLLTHPPLPPHTHTCIFGSLTHTLPPLSHTHIHTQQLTTKWHTNTYMQLKEKGIRRCMQPPNRCTHHNGQPPQTGLTFSGVRLQGHKPKQRPFQHNPPMGLLLFIYTAASIHGLTRWNDELGFCVARIPELCVPVKSDTPSQIKQRCGASAMAL